VHLKRSQKTQGLDPLHPNKLVVDVAVTRVHYVATFPDGPASSAARSVASEAISLSQQRPLSTMNPGASSMADDPTVQV
jgi:hypothetical protein